MDCFPLDEEIQASIPFSNNSVVLAASALLQRLLTYADDRNLQSVDVLLTSIWLLLREEKDREKEYVVELSDSNEKSHIKKSLQETTSPCKCLYAEAETQTEDSTKEAHNMDIKKIENKGRKGDDKSNERTVALGDTFGGTLNSFHISSSEGRKVVCSGPDANSNEKDISDNISNTAEIQSLVTAMTHTELEAATNGVGTSTKHILNSVKNNECSENKTFSLTKVRNHVLDKSVTESTEIIVDSRSKSSLLGKTHLLESRFESPPVLSPIIIHKKINADLHKESLDDNLFLKSDVKDKTQNSVNGPNSPHTVSADDSSDENRFLGERNAANHKGLDTLVETSDGKTFQISSDDGLTYEESFVIEKVGSDDSDTEMTINYDEAVSSNQTSMKASLNDEIIAEQQPDKKDYFEQETAVVRSGKNIDSMPNVAATEDILIENLGISQETYKSDTPEKPIRESFGGIVELDNDSELKIINIAGGVTFYDEPNQEDLPNDRIIDYLEKPGVSVYNPFSYSGFPPIQSSCTSLYSDVVYSSHSSFPATYMSVDPRLTVQNCPQYFVPNNLNLGMYMGTNEGGQLYQPAESQNQYGNVLPHFNQGFQYYLPQAETSDLSEPVQVKSESRVITATNTKAKKKKNRKEQSDDKLSPTCMKEYYNVRDKNGKFIKKEEIPYINNVRYSSYSLKGHKTGMKTPVKQEKMAGGLLDDANLFTKSTMMQKQHMSSGSGVSQDVQGVKQVFTGAQGDAKMCVTQLQKEYKETNEKLKALMAKKSTKLTKDMTEKERKCHKAFERRRLNLLKKLRSQKRKLRKYEKLEYVVRDKGTFVNASGLSEEYTVVTVKGLVLNSGTDHASKPEQETVFTPSNEPSQGCLKKTISLKESKGKKMLKKSLEKVNIVPLDNSNAKVKSAKQKLAAKKILKIKKAKTKQILKETVGKNKLKLKQTVSSARESDVLANPNVTEVTMEIGKKRGRGRPRKGEEMTKSKKRKKHKVNSLLNRTKTVKKTRAFAQLMTARKEKEQEEVKEIILAYHGERGAKLAAQQRISAYNESLSFDNAAKGEN